MKKEKLENLSEIMDKSQNSKSIEVIQRDSIQKNKKVKKIEDNKKSEKIQTKLEEPKKEEAPENVIITLPESEIISPDLPLDEDKKQNSNFSKNLVENIYEKQKSEINIGIIDGVEIGLNSVMEDIHDDIQENKIKVENMKQNFNEQSKNNASLNRNKSDYESLIKIN